LQKTRCDTAAGQDVHGKIEIEDEISQTRPVLFLFDSPFTASGARG
jgi:hypothetical protein